ncbi:hypothetical protein FRC00_009666, partial [Tulasnella sp. 408]
TTPVSCLPSTPASPLTPSPALLSTLPEDLAAPPPPPPRRLLPPPRLLPPLPGHLPPRPRPRPPLQGRPALPARHPQPPLLPVLLRLFTD